MLIYHLQQLLEVLMLPCPSRSPVAIALPAPFETPALPPSRPAQFRRGIINTPGVGDTPCRPPSLPLLGPAWRISWVVLRPLLLLLVVVVLGTVTVFLVQRIVVQNIEVVGRGFSCPAGRGKKNRENRKRNKEWEVFRNQGRPMVVRWSWRW